MDRLGVTVRRRLAVPSRIAVAGGLVGALADHEGPRPLHVATGVLFVLGVVVHLGINARWIVAVVRRLRRGLPRAVLLDLLLDAVMVVGAVAITVSGMAARAPAGGAGAGDGGVHGHVAVVLAAATTLHVLRHRGRMARRRGRAGRTGAAGPRAVSRPPATTR